MCQWELNKSNTSQPPIFLLSKPGRCDAVCLVYSSGVSRVEASSSPEFFQLETYLVAIGLQAVKLLSVLFEDFRLLS